MIVGRAALGARLATLVSAAAIDVPATKVYQQADEIQSHR